ncbi:hypothetical protein FSARC_9091 [Fusarium sarcochroum]|uniref:Uncharacterized protein n=1 Tax=Fusarium sarcochroum TaxID=1208366 RepID=A0A8H4TRJ8_9HYPO|nr:hypothetical protein FSARC_9091 [Fusarium sarcochroum]
MDSSDLAMIPHSISDEGNIQVVNLSSHGIPLEEARIASKWIAKAFAEARKYKLIFISRTKTYSKVLSCGTSISDILRSGILLGARSSGAWQGFRCLFPPGQGWQPYSVDYDTGADHDWDRFLELTGKEAYMSRVQEWGRLTGNTHKELGLVVDPFFTTSMIVVK